MQILAIETSCEHASVALLLDGELIERKLEGHTKHSERLIPTIHELLAQGGLSLGALSAVAFGAGPGAFTGLRLACGVAQGLAMGAGIGVIPVSSLAALALQGRAKRVFTLVDARMGEVYVAAYARENGEAVEVQFPQCLPPEFVCLPDGDDWYVMGSALAAYPGLQETIPASRIAGMDSGAVPRAAEVAELAVLQARRGAILAPELGAPIYIRDKVALTTAERLARGGKV